MFADLFSSMVNAGLVNDDATAAMQEAYTEQQAFIEQWICRILRAAGVEPDDLWMTGLPATDKQLRAIQWELKQEQPIVGLTFLQAKALLQVLNGHKYGAKAVASRRHRQSAQQKGALDGSQQAGEKPPNGRGVSGAGGAHAGANQGGSVARPPVQSVAKNDG